MVTYLVRRKINRRISQIIHQDRQRNKWTIEKLATMTGLTLDQVKTIKATPATVPCCDLYRLVESGLDSLSQNEFAWASMELQLSTVFVRRRLHWLVKIEKTLVALLKKYGPFALGIIVGRLIWDLASLLMQQ